MISRCVKLMQLGQPGQREIFSNLWDISKNLFKKKWMKCWQMNWKWNSIHFRNNFSEWHPLRSAGHKRHNFIHWNLNWKVSRIICSFGTGRYWSAEHLTFIGIEDTASSHRHNRNLRGKWKGSDTLTGGISLSISLTKSKLPRPPRNQWHESRVVQSLKTLTR